LQYLKYTKLIKIVKGIANFCDKKGVTDKKVKHNNNKTKNQTSKPLPEVGIEPGTSYT